MSTDDKNPRSPGDWRPVPETQSDKRVQSSLHVIRARHQNTLKLWGLVDNMERMCAGPTFYDTPPGTVPEIRLPDWLLSVSGLGSPSLSGISICSVFLSILFQLICSNWLKCEGRGREYYVLFQPPWLILSSEYHASTSGASLVYIPAPSPDWSGICPRTILIPFVAQHQPTRQLICSDRKSVPLRVASFHSSPRQLGPTVSSPFTGRIWWVLPQPPIQQPKPPTTTPPTPLPFAVQIPLPFLRPRLTQRQARQLESCLSFCWAFVIITITV